MSTDARKKCILKSIDKTHSHPHIEISANDFTFVGRSPECELRDELVSRKQLKLKADFTRNCLIFEAMGANPSTLNFKQLKPNVEYQATHGDIIEVLAEKYPYEVHFENVDENENENASESVNDDSTVANAYESKNDYRNTDGKAKKPIAETGASRDKNKHKRHRESGDENDKDDEGDEDDAPLKRRATEKSKLILVLDKATLPDTQVWQTYNKSQVIVYTSADCVAAKKIAAYDMDGTLITTKSGKVFPNSLDDWKIAFGTVKSTLTAKHAENYKIVIFTNQAGVSSGKVSLSDLREKIESIIKHIGLPVQVFIATDHSQFRKPMTMMWQALSDHLNDDVCIDMDESFFVGDAAGRPENKILKKKKDHSCVDRLFAMNLNLKFFTPEEHFLKQPPALWKKPEFEPRDALTNKPDSLLQPASSQLKSDTIEVIIMVGGPGSGKSTFCRKHLASNGYVVVNRDTLKTWQKCVKQCSESLRDGKKVVIDNTNGKPEERDHYIKEAKKRNVKCRCFVMATTFSHAEHNIHFRELIDPSHAKVNRIVLNTYKKYYKKPTKNEGFDEIVTVNFIPTFRNDYEKTLYGMYLLES